MIPGNLPRRGRMPTAQQQRIMMQTVQALNNPVLSANGGNTVSVNQDGISARNYTPQRIVARITGHGTGNLYSFEQVLITASSGTVSTLTGGSTGSTTVFAAIELNGRTDVPTGAIVDMIADAGPYGFSFIYNGGNTSSGTLADAAVHVTATGSGGVGTWKVRQVYWNGAAWAETSPTVQYDNVREAQDREPVVDSSPTVTHAIPLFVDRLGTYYFQIDQYADGTNTLPGLVSSTTQFFEGPKRFEDDVLVNTERTVANNAVAFAVFGGSGFEPFQIIKRSGTGAGNTANNIYIGVDPANTGDLGSDLTNVAVNGNISCWQSVFIGKNDANGDLQTGYVWLEPLAADAKDALGLAQNVLYTTSDSGSYLGEHATTSLGYEYNGGSPRVIFGVGNDDGIDSYISINGNLGVSGTFAISGGSSGDLASMTFTGGILTAVTLVP